MNQLLLNISGHSLSESAIKEFENKYDAIETIPFDEVDFSLPIEPQIDRILAAAKSPLDGSCAVTVVLPGQSTLAVAVFIYLHGMLGFFPDIYLLQPSADGVFMPSSLLSVDSRQLRMKGRALRQTIIRNKNDA